MGNVSRQNLRRIALRVGFVLLAAVSMYLLASSQTSWASSETQEHNTSASVSPGHEYESSDSQATEFDDSGDDGENQGHTTPPPVPPITPTPTVTPTPTATPTVTPSPSVDPTPTGTPTSTAGPTSTPGPTGTPTGSPTPTPTPTRTSLGPVEVPNGTGNSSKGGNQQTTLSANKANTGLRLQGSGWSLDLIGRNSKGANVELDASGNIVFRQGHQAYTSGTGFKPNSTVNVYIFSSPVLIGTVQTDSAGSFEGLYSLPSGLEAGAHTVQVDGFAPDGAIRTANVPVLYATPKASTAKLTVYFTPDSARLTSAAKSALKLFVAGIPSGAEDIVSSTKGYVFPFRSRADNLRISAARAQTITAAIKAAGVKASYKSAGLGRLQAKSKTSRRVELEVSYNVYTAFVE